jgi:hypothetical protein
MPFAQLFSGQGLSRGGGVLVGAGHRVGASIGARPARRAPMGSPFGGRHGRRSEGTEVALGWRGRRSSARTASGGEAGAAVVVTWLGSGACGATTATADALSVEQWWWRRQAGAMCSVLCETKSRIELCMAGCGRACMDRVSLIYDGRKWAVID